MELDTNTWESILSPLYQLLSFLLLWSWRFSLLMTLYLFFDLLNTFLCWRAINKSSTPVSSKATTSSFSSGRRFQPHKLAPDFLLFADALRFIPLKMIYLLRMGTAFIQTAVVWWFPSVRKPISHSTVIQLLLNSAYIMLLKTESTTTSPNYQGRFVLAMENIASPYFQDKYDCHLKVVFDVTTESVDLFQYNELSISEPAEMLSILLHTNGTTAHPMIHSFHNRHYQRREEAGEHYVEMFLHGQSLNFAAHYYTGLMFGCGPEWLRKVLTFNSEKIVPMHSLATLKLLLPYSRTGRFLVEARSVVFTLVRKHRVPVDPETWFICSIMHSLDHYMPGQITSGRFMFHKQLPNQWYWTNMLAAVFYFPVQSSWCNNLLSRKRDRNPFYQELYSKLRVIDQQLADEVSLSLSY